MDLSYSSEAEAYREGVTAFLAENWPLTEKQNEELSYEEQCDVFRKRATDAGYLYRNIPKQYGGSEQEPDVILGQVIREEFSKKWAPMEVRGIGPMMLVPTLLERGEEWMKEKFVERTLSGEIKWCQGYSEPGSGSDLASLKTRGEIVGDEWVINGQKIWTTSAHQADYMFILVRTEPDASKHAGISYLLIDMKQPGIDARPLRQMTGTIDFNEVFFTDAKTPKDWIVGKRGEGWNVSRTTLKHERNSIGATEQTNAQFNRLLKLPDDVREKYDVSSLRAMIHAAAPCPVETKWKMLNWWGDSIYEYYAATEGGGTLVTPQEWRTYPGTVGKAWTNSDVKIYDDDANELPPNTVGTVYMLLGQADFEYKDAKKKTRENRIDNFFTVGDIGELNEDGYLFLRDRKADMIISGGANIYPAEIEAVLLSHPKVGDAAAFGIPNEDWGEEVKVVIEPAENAEASDALRDDIFDFCKDRLAKYKTPKTIDFIEVMPRDPNGKLYKRKLRDPYWEGRSQI